MTIVSDWIIPIITVVIGLGFASGLYFLFKFLFELFFGKLGLWIKYKIFRRDYDEEQVEFCVDVLEKGLEEEDVKRHLLINNIPLKKAEEIIFIFKQIKKEMKGGEDGKVKQSIRKNSIPKI